MRRELRNPDLVGTFATPDGDGPFPAVLALAGSDGGIPKYFLEMLVPHGFACLALAYHQGTVGTELGDLVPADMYDLPLERIERGLEWLRQQPQVTTHDGRVGVIGLSKGSELALLVAATFPHLVGPVVVYAPANVVWQGFSWTDLAHPRKTSTWSHHGEPLAFVPFPKGVGPEISERGMALMPIYDRGLDDLDAVQRASIRVEDATGPLLLISGGDDQVCPAARMGELALARMEAHGRGADVRHLNYPEAGHNILCLEPMSVDPEAPVQGNFGGTPEADRAAGEDALPRVLAHLRTGGLADEEASDRVGVSD